MLKKETIAKVLCCMVPGASSKEISDFMIKKGTHIKPSSVAAIKGHIVRKQKKGVVEIKIE